MLMNPFAAPGPAAPQVLMEGASREQIIAAVNQNSSRIHSLTVTGATITVPDMMGLPLLSGNIAAERPGRFRLTAGTAVTGQEIDLGSNDELFWLWVRRNQPPGVYFCRHAQFANSNIRQMMPVEPSWLLAALGMVDLDPASVFDGPLPRRATAPSSCDRGCHRPTARCSASPSSMPGGRGSLGSTFTINPAKHCSRAPWPSRTATIRSSKCRCPSWFRFACRRQTWRSRSISGTVQINQL